MTPANDAGFFDIALLAAHFGSMSKKQNREITAGLAKIA
jgi:hypothetical protein